jgi:hypothetical protein
MRAGRQAIRTRCTASKHSASGSARGSLWSIRTCTLPRQAHCANEAAVNQSAILCILSLSALGCRSSEPHDPWNVAPAARPGEPSESITLHLDPDGSIRSRDRILYDPKSGDSSALRAFLAEQRTTDPNVAIRFLADPDVSVNWIERASELAGENLAGRGPITFNIQGSVQATLRGR